FATVTVTDVQVIPDRTTEIDVTMQEEVLQGEEIVVVAERPIVERDRTTTTAFVDQKQIEALPVTSVSEIIDLQAGVVEGHFRGGRTNEVSYVVNGVPINNPYNNTAAFEVEQNMISSLEVITGVFNAEYGQATSGVVNIETKSAPSKWTASALGFVRAIASTRKYPFLNRVVEDGQSLTDLRYDNFVEQEYSLWDIADPTNRVEGNLTVGGPIVKEKLGVVLNARYVNDRGTLFGRDLFRPGDYSSYIINPPLFGYRDPENPQQDYVIESTGTGDFVPMSTGERLSLNGTAVLQIARPLKLEYNVFFQDGNSQGFSHSGKYVPDGRNTGYFSNITHIVGLRYVFSGKTFGNLSYSFQNDKYDSYLYKDSSNPLLVPSNFASQTGEYAFRVGGNDLFSVDQRTRSHNIVASISSQVSRAIQIKTGVQARFYELDNDSYPILHIITGSDNRTSRPTSWNVLIPDEQDWRRNILKVKPREISAYVQDKIELTNLIINTGVRFDLFDPNYIVPRFWSQADSAYVRDPSNPADSIYNRIDTSVKYQFSPRVGVAFPISERGVIRFSYGMFFQVPNYSDIFANPNYTLNRGGTVTNFGNPDIQPQRTSTFEIGLQQGVTDALGMELTLFTKDVRELLASEIQLTDSGDFIVRSINRTYGTVRGFTLSIFQRPIGPVAWTVDYTLQFADGSYAVSGDQFLRVRNGLDETFSLARLEWDRRHVVNNTVTVSPTDDLRLTLINRLTTGRPYTSVRSFVQSTVPYNVDRPTSFLSDLRVYYKPFFLPTENAQIFLQVDNLFDSKIQTQVYSDSGTATETPTLERNRNVQIQGLNTIDEYFSRQDFFGAPRRVALGLSLNF
ncbi:MAG: TonB-dependent receptor, partial [Bacteroidetes bacterium]|nr:TonB-dependent receptor [Bacteroidota bacterium]